MSFGLTARERAFVSNEATAFYVKKILFRKRTWSDLFNWGSPVLPETKLGSLSAFLGSNEFIRVFTLLARVVNL